MTKWRRSLCGHPASWKGRMETHISRQTDVIESLTSDLEELGARDKNGQVAGLKS